jgi:hypothetical protein
MVMHILGHGNEYIVFVFKIGINQGAGNTRRFSNISKRGF